MNTSKTDNTSHTRFEATAIIMAGGLSLRMGTDKTLLPLGGHPLIEHVIQQVAPLFEETIISANTEGRFTRLPYKTVVDQTPGQGPIMGLISSIEAARYDTCFVQACDIPETNIPLIQKMLSLVSNYDAVVPKTRAGYHEPLFAVYRKSAVSAMKAILRKERGRCSLIPERCNSITVELEEREQLRNLNTPDDYTEFLNIIRKDK